MESSPYQATAGKLALRIKVTDRAGKRIGFGRATGRHFAEILSSLTLGIGFVMAGFTKRRQALHDMIASTLVVMKSASPETVAENPVAQTLPAWGIGALVVAGSLVPIGIVAAIAIPAYQDYTIQAQVSEGLSLAAEYKAAVAEAAISGLQWEDINSGVNGFPVARSEKYVKSIEIVSGVVLVTYGQSASADIAGTVLALIPGITDSNELIWVCGYARAPDGAALVLQEHEQYSDVAERYLPAACRSG